MGWKSTIEITRSKAISSIIEKIINASNYELADILCNLDFGDDVNLPYHGHNFNVVDELTDNEEKYDETRT